ncbi:haloacid dehalogenase-like hydrolase [Paenibacillus validus]|uniref:Haloacid dehalogenase-like hydrolase n=1 Tax=Paenibacillus chartarius TaxID=747481 RepID=A0ABV6DLN7_9BACL|nr:MULTISPECIES: haloacid dehalogenase-like hydrolase [Paenibacillus]MED4600048.1 haloacid dehalogenase-like hydrolase [Paenibacillus validus]MED4605685.1 haloacid dehalogenase-like hydrolase [Paenibacillus validus]NTZ20715.1 haloacid dehalogenase [Paenibacillus sp. JMULE4]
MKHSRDFSQFDGILANGVNHAVIDVDNTITKSNIVQFYLFIKRERLKNRLLWWLFLVYCLAAAPFYLAVDRLSRDWFNHVFVQRKFGKYAYEQLEKYAQRYFEEMLKRQFIVPVHDLIFYLKEKGVQVTLLSTNFDLIVKHYGAYFQVPYVCLPVVKQDSRIRIDFSQLKGFKRNYIQRLNPAMTMAIGDSKYDLPMLEHVHYPIIVANKKKKWMKSIQREAVLIRA